MTTLMTEMTYLPGAPLGMGCPVRQALSCELDATEDTLAYGSYVGGEMARLGLLAHAADLRARLGALDRGATYCG